MTDHSKILILTDLHLRGPGKTIIGLDPMARFKAALKAAVSDHPDAEVLICMGDLTHSGRAEEYAALKDALAACPIPPILMLGNHDDRQTFMDTFPEASVTASGHVQQVLDLPFHRIITLDSHDPEVVPEHAGTLCQDRLNWLDQALQSAGSRMPLVFVHHPPHDVGLPGMDAIKLTNGSALLDRLQRTGAHLFCGHIHRTIMGQTRGIPFTIFKSPCHQAPLDLTAADSTLSTAEPGAYGLLLLSEGQAIVHTEDVGVDKTAISGSDALPGHQ